MIKIKLLKNVRIFDDYATDITITTGQIKTIKKRDLQAYSLRGALFDGTLQVTEGDVIIPIKKARILFSVNSPLKCYGIESVRGEPIYFEKDLVTQDYIYYKDAEDMPIEFKNKLEGKTPLVEAIDDTKVFAPVTDAEKTDEKASNILIGEVDSFAVVDDEELAEDENLMTKSELLALYKKQQVAMIKELTTDKVPNKEEDRVELLLNFQDEGADLRDLLSKQK